MDLAPVAPGEDHPPEALVVPHYGDLDAEWVNHNHDLFADAIEGRDVRTILVDLRDVAFIDSTALGMMIGAQRVLRIEGVQLLLRNPLTAVRAAFAAAGLDGMFEELTDDEMWIP